MGLPPLLAGAVKLMEAWAFPAVATPTVGAAGVETTALGVTGAEGSEVRVAPFE